MKTLYVHIPFCFAKCFYCSFVVSVGQARRIDDYLDCLELEAKRYGRPDIDTVYCGGGTPSFLNVRQMERLIRIIRDHFRLKEGLEWTMEVNPEQLGPDKLQCMHMSGVNRVSLGIQSLNDHFLSYLGRHHNAQSAVESFEAVRKAGFKNVNVDLMFSFPDQSLEQLNKDVASVSRLGSEHISLYMLTIEENSRFHARRVRLQDGEDQARHYTTVCRILSAAGYEQYEVSNFARPGFSSVHNINYWQAGEYIGLGVGAHSHIGQKRSWNVSRLTEYISLIKGGKSAEEGSEMLRPAERFNEALLFGLRMNRGVNLGLLERQYGRSTTKGQNSAIAEMIRSGFLAKENSVLKATDRGRLVLDELSARLI